MGILVRASEMAAHQIIKINTETTKALLEVSPSTALDLTKFASIRRYLN